MSSTEGDAVEAPGAAHIVALIRRHLSDEPARTREFERALDAFRGGAVDARNAAARLERLFPDDVQIARLLRALFRPDRAEEDAITQLRRRFAVAAAPAVRNQFPVERPIIAAAPERDGLYPAFFAALDAPTHSLAADESIASEIAPVHSTETGAVAAAAKETSAAPAVLERAARSTRATLVAAYRRKAEDLVLENAMELATQLDVQRRHWSDVRRAYSARARAPARAAPSASSSASASASASASPASAAPRIPSMLVHSMTRRELGARSQAVAPCARGEGDGVASYTCSLYESRGEKVLSVDGDRASPFVWETKQESKKRGRKGKYSVARMAVAVRSSQFVAPLPKSVGFISVTSNFRAEDEPVLRYVPYFGEDDETSIDVSYYEAVPSELDREMASEVDEQTLVAMTRRFGCGDDVYAALSKTLNYAPVVLRKRRKEIGEVSVLLCTVTLYANLAHSLTRSP